MNIKLEVFFKETLEFFKNDFYIYYDFLTNTDTWDLSIAYLLGINIEEVNILKERLVKNIIDEYKKMLIESLDNKKINEVDYHSLMKHKDADVVKMFFFDEDAYIIIMKYYVNMHCNKLSFKKDTFNWFKYDIRNLVALYKSLNEFFKIDEIYDEIDTYDVDYVHDYVNEFNAGCYAEIVKQFKTMFRTIEEENEFINYLFSLCVPYVYIKKDTNILDSSEVSILAVLEEGLNAREVFYYNHEIAIDLVSIITELTDKCWPNIDFRKCIKDTNYQRMFEEYDKHYKDKFDKDVMISGITIDYSIEDVLSELFITKTNKEIIDILLGDESIYDLLVENKLDARKERYYKNLIIKKILSDVYEYEHLKSGKKKNVINVDVLEAMIKSQKYKQYFKDNYDVIIKEYKEYHSSDYNVEKARIKIFNSGKVKEVSDILKTHYLLIESGSLYSLYSVDKINEVITLLKKDKNALLTSKKCDLYLKIICMCLYENLILENIQNDSIKQVIRIIESKDYLNIIKGDKNNIDMLINLFLFYYEDVISYSSEIKRRDTLNKLGYEKTLKRLNPFEKKDKRQ